MQSLNIHDLLPKKSQPQRHLHLVDGDGFEVVEDIDEDPDFDTPEDLEDTDGPLLFPAGWEEQPIGRIRYRREQYHAAYDAAGLDRLADWAVDYLAGRAVSPEMAAKRGYRSGKGLDDLPEAGEGLHWSKATLAWVESGTYMAVHVHYLPNTNVVQNMAYGEESLKAPQEWLVQPAHMEPGGGRVRPQLRYRERLERITETWDKRTKTIKQELSKFDWPARDNYDEVPERAIDFLHFDPEDETSPICVGEGSIKMDRLAGFGFQGIGIPGIQQATRGRTNELNDLQFRATLSPEIFEHLHDTIADRVIYLVPDSDHHINPDVMKAVVNMISAFIRAGSPMVKVVDIPTEIFDPVTGEHITIPGGGIGFDDYTAARMETTPNGLWVKELFENAIDGRDYIARAREYEKTDVGRGQRVADWAENTGSHLHITEGDQKSGSWWVHSGRNWHVDADRKAIRALAIEAARWEYGVDKKDTSVTRKNALSSSSINSAVDLATTDWRLARFSTIWEPLDWSEHFPAANALIDLLTKQGVPHDPKALNLYCSDVNYVPGKVHPYWEEYRKKYYVSEVTDPGTGIVSYEYDPELERLEQEFFGAMLTGRTYDAFLIMKGDGGCGMSTTIKAVTNVLGSYAGTLKKDDLCGGGDKFVASGIVNKRGVVSGEPNDGDKIDAGLLKTLAQDGEDRDVEVKHKTAKGTRNTGSIVIPTNHDLGVDMAAEDNDAIRRRARIARHTRKIPDDEKTGDVTNRLADPDVQEAILVWLVEGAHRVIKNGRQVCRTTSSDKEVADWLAGKDRFSRFLDERTSEVKPGMPGFNDPDTGIHCQSFYGVYTKWCEANEIPEEFQVASYNFKQRVSKHFGPSKKDRAGRNVWRNRTLK